MNASKCLKDYRKDNKLTQPQLAKLAGVGERTIQTIEAGNKVSDKKLNAVLALMNKKLAVQKIIIDVPEIK